MLGAFIEWIKNLYYNLFPPIDPKATIITHDSRSKWESKPELSDIEKIDKARRRRSRRRRSNKPKEN